LFEAFRPPGVLSDGNPIVNKTVVDARDPALDAWSGV